MSQQQNELNICSLLPSGTEILFALGLGDRVVGVSDLCDYPPAAKTKRIVSRSKVDAAVLTSEQVENEMRRLLEAGEELFELDRDWLTRHPVDVVLTQDICYFCEVDAAQVMDAVQGMAREPRVEVLQPRTLGEILASIDVLEKTCDTFSVHVATAELDGLRSALHGFGTQREATERHAALWAWIRNDRRFTPMSVPRFRDEEEPSGRGTMGEAAIDSVFLANHLQIPLLVDDRTCQSVALNERNSCEKNAPPSGLQHKILSFSATFSPSLPFEVST